jgi:hypothetical protein
MLAVVLAAVTLLAAAARTEVVFLTEDVRRALGSWDQA